ncbi:MAG: ribonuclease HI family protein [Cyanobacteriota bacterium]
MGKTKTKWDAKITFDGGSRGNPGSAAGAAIIKYQGETYTNTRFLPHATNNEAEYTGCIVGLEKALELGCQQITVSGDSKLIINQLDGSYQVKSPSLRNYYNQASALLKQFENVDLIWIPRNQNSAADQAVNDCIDKNTGVSQLREKALDLPTVPASGKMAGQIQRLIKLGKGAKYKDYSNLKSGSDSFSKQRMSKLIEQVSDEVRDAIASAMFEYEDSVVAKAYRWYLRGLPVDMAIHKVKVDLEAGAHAVGAPVAEFGKKSPVKTEPKKLTVTDKEKLKPCSFAKGEYVRIQAEGHSKNGMIGIVCQNPSINRKGESWLLKVEIEGVRFPIYLEESEVVAALPDNFENLSI